VTTEDAEQAINEIIEGKTGTNPHPKTYQDYLDYLKSVSKLLQDASYLLILNNLKKDDKQSEKIAKSANDLISYCNRLKLFLNEDYLSQVVNSSASWQSITSNAVSYHSTHYIAQTIFGKPGSELTIFQNALLNITLALRAKQSEFKTKYFCEECNKTDEVVEVHRRQRECSNGHNVKGGVNRLIKHYYRKDKNETMIVYDDIFGVSSWLEFFIENFDKKLDSIEAVRQAHKETQQRFKK
jgi:hypothetical protein